MKSTGIRSSLVSFAIAALFVSPTVFPQSGGASLEGTYSIDRRASEDTNALIEDISVREQISAADRRDLEKKLQAPETLSFEIAGDQVTISTSNNGAPVVVKADGVSRSSVRNDGTPVRTRAAFRGASLTISSLGGENDYTLTFTPIDNGSGLKVTRRITTPYMTETVFADSIYRRSGGYDDVGSADTQDEKDYVPADDQDGYSDSGGGVIFNPTSSSDKDRKSSPGPRKRPARMGNFVVPTGSVVSGRLNNFVSTDASQENDRFSLTVESPSQFRGAVIEGYLSDIERTGKILGRPRITFNFETITMPDGRRYDFAGVLQTITDSEGDEIRINDEGEARGKSRTTETMKRSGIGAGLGAILGAILGGGKGAVIGATIGAGAGAGSMIPGKRNDLEIPAGATLAIQATGNGR